MLFRPFIACALTSGAVMAAGAPPAVEAPAGPLPWRSALEGYRPFAEAPVAPWRESNDTVGRIGGWRAYAREASGMRPAPAASTPAAAAASARTPAPAPGGHRH